MKKIIIIIMFFVLLAVNAALTGDGTFTNPWSGILEGDATWSGTKYINGDITVDNEKLTISPGAIIIFLSETADLIITGTGQVEADGAAGSLIRFTSDDDNDGNFGETGESWGHISFQYMGSAGPSVLDYCIIEYGDVRNAGSSDNPFKYGGAVHAAFNDLTISNCILQNNKAKWGGALFVNQNFSPSIKNCLVFNNESIRAGGGFYFWLGSRSVVENCIFDSNDCLEPINERNSGGGLYTQSGTMKVLNCTFVNNTTTRSAGASIELYGSIGDIVQNCIFWGNGTHFLRIGGSNLVQYCAVQGTIPAGTGNFQLNAINTAINGPNFAATDGSDWSIKFISPCRDAGNTTNPAVPNDYPGNSRISVMISEHTKYQYSRWTGASGTDWTISGNWEANIDPSFRNRRCDYPNRFINLSCQFFKSRFYIRLRKTNDNRTGSKSYIK